MEVQLQLALFCFLFAEFQSSGLSPFREEPPPPHNFLYHSSSPSFHLYFFCVFVVSSLLFLHASETAVILTRVNRKINTKNLHVRSQKHVHHHKAQRSWRRTVCSSTSCPTWVAPGSKPLVMRRRHRGPWPPCELKAPSPSPSRCMSPVVLRALSGQPDCTDKWDEVKRRPSDETR